MIGLSKPNFCYSWAPCIGHILQCFPITGCTQAFVECQHLRVYMNKQPRSRTTQLNEKSTKPLCLSDPVVSLSGAGSEGSRGCPQCRAQFQQVQFNPYGNCSPATHQCTRGLERLYPYTGDMVKNGHNTIITKAGNTQRSTSGKMHKLKYIHTSENAHILQLIYQYG